jgi:hypothetical protein
VDPAVGPVVIEHDGSHEVREHSPSVEIDVQGCPSRGGGVQPSFIVVHAGVARQQQLDIDIRFVAQEA